MRNSCRIFKVELHESKAKLLFAVRKFGGASAFRSCGGKAGERVWAPAVSFCVCVEMLVSLAELLQLIMREAGERV